MNAKESTKEEARRGLKQRWGKDVKKALLLAFVVDDLSQSWDKDKSVIIHATGY